MPTFADVVRTRVQGQGRGHDCSVAGDAEKSSVSTENDTSSFASANCLRCLPFAALLIAGCGSPIKGADVELTEVARLDAFGCVHDDTDDETEYCTIVDIDGVPAVPREDYRTYFGLLPGEHHIKVRNERDVQKAIVEMSFVAQSGHWYEVREMSVRFPQWRFFVYDGTGGAVVAHVRE